MAGRAALTGNVLTLHAERLPDVLRVLEREAFTRRTMRRTRNAIVRSGELLNLRDYFESRQTDRRDAPKDVTMSLEASVPQILGELWRVTVPVEIVSVKE